MAQSQQADFIIENYGTLFLVRCQNLSAKHALKDAIEPDAQWFGAALAVEPRFIVGLVSALRERGWRVR